ncbi:hypothetical protein [Solicola sp. PLA-1-18]|uniref:hypothetical protein n=1 Tax=Solicola sp. PLA-1-18 TaxID=3380532 RepID=UPI003B77BD96
MREYVSAALCGALVTLVACAVSGAGAATAALAVGATLAVLAWATAQLSQDTEAGIPVADVAWGFALALRGRTAPGRLLPLVAAQVVGAVVAGLGASLVGGRLAATPDVAPPGLGTAALLGVVVGLVGGLAAVLADLHAQDAAAGLSGVVGGALLPGALGSAAHPAALLGVAAAGSLGWTTALVTGVTVLVGHGLAGLWMRAVVAEAEVL